MYCGSACNSYREAEGKDWKRNREPCKGLFQGIKSKLVKSTYALLCLLCPALHAELLCSEAWESLLYSYTGCGPGWDEDREMIGQKGKYPGWEIMGLSPTGASDQQTRALGTPVREGVPTPRPSSNGPATLLTFRPRSTWALLGKHLQPIVHPPFIFSGAALLPQHLPPSPGPPSLTSVPAQPAKFFNIKIMAHLTLLLQIAASQSRLSSSHQSGRVTEAK